MSQIAKGSRVFNDNIYVGSIIIISWNHQLDHGSIGGTPNNITDVEEALQWK